MTDIMRDGEQSLSCDELARAVMARNGMVAGDRTALRRISEPASWAYAKRELSLTDSTQAVGEFAP